MNEYVSISRYDDILINTLTEPANLGFSLCPALVIHDGVVSERVGFDPA